jgi:hypothetical protein
VDSTGYFGPKTRKAMVEALVKGGGGNTSALGARVNAALANTGLAGLGYALADQAAKNRVPVDMIMAMLQKESSFLSVANSWSRANRNPGNLRFAEWERNWGGRPGGVGNFTIFPSVENGLRAMIDCLGTYYRADVDNRDWNSLIWKWAPSWDGNDTNLYIRQMYTYSAHWRSVLGL